MGVSMFGSSGYVSHCFSFGEAHTNAKDESIYISLLLEDKLTVYVLQDELIKEKTALRLLSRHYRLVIHSVFGRRYIATGL